MWTGTEMYLDSESESDSEMEIVILLYSMTKKRKKSVWMHDYLKQRNTHEEFLLLKELNNSRTKMYFRLNKEQFVEIHTLIMNDITGRGCNAQQPIESDLKLAVTLRYVRIIAVLDFYLFLVKYRSKYDERDSECGVERCTSKDCCAV
ncbi:hypothetical protein FQA39_LY02056 [Lamprigera yunnana]|nr:hypothetical protein FQA39_LY02056 [Lamprigera yunnana]